MKYGPLIFLGLLFAMALSWLGMIATPQLQIGDAQPTNVPPANLIYPVPYSGMANLGREVYRANGCAYCHTQVIRQEGDKFDVVLSNPGTNQADLVRALLAHRPGLDQADAEKLAATGSNVVLTTSLKSEADAAQKAFSDAGAGAAVHVVPTGPDIARGWGPRLTVAHDYVYSSPLMLGSARLGPDLTNVGLRRPDETWHLTHLYNPRLQVPGSTMPRYPFLFEKRARGRRPSPDALPIPSNEEIIPTREARALVAYLLNLRAEMPLFEAPAPPILTSSAVSGDTNQPPATGAATNGPGASAAPASPAPTQPAPK